MSEPRSNPPSEARMCMRTNFFSLTQLATLVQLQKGDYLDDDDLDAMFDSMNLK